MNNPFNSIKSDKVIQVDSIIEELGLLVKLSHYEVCVVSTVHAGLDLAGSDIDIVGSYFKQSEFVSDLRTLNNVGSVADINVSNDYVVCSFIVDHFKFEIYGSDTPVCEQHGYLHYCLMLRLVAIGGKKFQQAIRHYKQQGLKTEPSIARYFNLCGDPYQSVLTLNQYTDGEIKALMST